MTKEPSVFMSVDVVSFPLQIFFYLSRFNHKLSTILEASLLSSQAIPPWPMALIPSLLTYCLDSKSVYQLFFNIVTGMFFKGTSFVRHSE